MAGLERRLYQTIRVSKFADDESDYEESRIPIDEGSRNVKYVVNEFGEGSEDSGKSEDDDGGDGSGTDNNSESADSAAEDGNDKGQQSAADALSNISFGALASAQAAIGPSLKRKRGQQEPEVGAPPSQRRSRSPSPFREAEERLAGKKLSSNISRSSKHAPMEVSSKKAVSRKRTVVAVAAKPQARDPRFSTLSGQLNEAGVKANYSFLNDYRASELEQLRASAKKEKDEAKRERLKKQLRAIEDRNRAAQKVEGERAIVREHRKRERDAVKQGKQPFFLKKTEIKKQALMKKYEGVSDKRIDKMMEKRRKRQAAKERRNMPQSRRLQND